MHSICQGCLAQMESIQFKVFTEPARDQRLTCKAGTDTAPTQAATVLEAIQNAYELVWVTSRSSRVVAVEPKRLYSHYHYPDRYGIY